MIHKRRRARLSCLPSRYDFGSELSLASETPSEVSAICRAEREMHCRRPLTISPVDKARILLRELEEAEMKDEDEDEDGFDGNFIVRVQSNWEWGLGSREKLAEGARTHVKAVSWDF